MIVLRRAYQADCAAYSYRYGGMESLAKYPWRRMWGNKETMMKWRLYCADPENCKGLIYPTTREHVMSLHYVHGISARLLVLRCTPGVILRLPVQTPYRITLCFGVGGRGKLHRQQVIFEVLHAVGARSKLNLGWQHVIC